jgi:hypothetical protein
MIWADHCTDLLRDNDRHMDVHGDEADVQRELLKYAAEERAKLIGEREANITQLRQQHKAEITADFREADEAQRRASSLRLKDHNFVHGLAR